LRVRGSSVVLGKPRLDETMSTVPSISGPPHNLEAEKSVLGAVLLDERHLYPLLIEEHLRPEDFYREQHGLVFAAMIELYQNDRKIDHLTVSEHLREQGRLEEAGGAEAIDELGAWVPAAGHARDYGRIVRDNARMRALLTTSYAIQASVLAREAPPRELLDRMGAVFYFRRAKHNPLRATSPQICFENQIWVVEITDDEIETSEVVGEMGRQRLDGDAAVESDVAGEVNDAHAAAADFAEQFVLAGQRVGETAEVVGLCGERGRHRLYIIHEGGHRAGLHLFTVPA